MTHHRSHAVLLPQGAGWEWYEAMSDYVRRFRPTLTQSADDAVSFRGQAHTVTVIHPASWNARGAQHAAGQEDDIVAWLRNAQSAGQSFEIDVVRVSEPAALRRALADRILKSQRYGSATAPVTATPQPRPQQPQPKPVPQPKPEEQKLKLVWPTDHKVITQRFGMRPEYYGQFGLPGHEGLDIRAPNGANIYACADGVVNLVLVNWRAGTGGRRADHPYGYHVRVRHKRADGEYETIYAHCQEGSAKVKEGDVVTAGQLIALGDSTGNVSGAHLHLTLKKIGAKNGGYGEIVNPEPFFDNLPV
jgi:murein DD-endopeptidase MepM/ murein hydrolase activator NlpD